MKSRKQYTSERNSAAPIISNMGHQELISAKELFSAIEELLAQGRQAAFTVTGMSMWPFLCHDRDRVIVESCDPNTILKGDIVLLQTSLGNYILHRVTKITDIGFETTGDGNCFRDGEFPFSCIKAKVVRLIRKGVSIECGSRKWRALSQIWMNLFPVRKGIFFVWFSIRRV